MKRITATLLLLSCAAQADDFCASLDAQAATQGVRTDSTENVYKVTGKGRLFFYSAPDNRCPMADTFIIPGQQVYNYVEYKNYALVMYMAKGDRQVTGWVDKARLIASDAGVGPNYEEQKATPQAMTASDFTIVISGQLLTLGEAWDNSTIRITGNDKQHEFVGNMPYGKSSYKFWQHHYSGYSVYSSNLFWDKQQRDIDSYIIAQIDLNSPTIATERGIKTGDSEEQLIAAYGMGNLDNSDHQRWISYDTADKRLSFQIEDSRISHIIMAFNMDI